MDEKVVWKGSPSHIVNLGVYLLYLIISALFVFAWIAMGAKIKAAGTVVFWLAVIVTMVPVGIILYRWLKLKTLRYEVSSERIRIRSGILSKEQNAVELYRVKDYVLSEPFFMRLFRLGSVELVTSDPTSPSVLLRAVHQPHKLLDEIRIHVEACRDRKGVRQLDVDRIDELDGQAH